MDDAPQQPFAAAFRRWWWMIVAAAVVAGAVSYLVSARGESVYTAKGEVLVGPISSDTDTLTAAGLLAGTYTQLIQSSEVIDPTVAELGSAIAPVGSWGDMDIMANGDTRIVTVAVDSNDAALAARIVNVLIENLQAAVSQTAVATTGNVTLLEAAVPPSAPSAPKPMRAALIGAAAGLAAAIAIAVIVEALRGSRSRAATLRQKGLADTP